MMKNDYLNKIEIGDCAKREREREREGLGLGLDVLNQVEPDLNSIIFFLIMFFSFVKIDKLIF